MRVSIVNGLEDVKHVVKWVLCALANMIKIPIPNLPPSEMELSRKSKHRMHYMSLCLINVLVTSPAENVAMVKPDLVRSILLIYINDALISRYVLLNDEYPIGDCS